MLPSCFLHVQSHWFYDFSCRKMYLPVPRLFCRCSSSSSSLGTFQVNSLSCHRNQLESLDLREAFKNAALKWLMARGLIICIVPPLDSLTIIWYSLIMAKSLLCGKCQHKIRLDFCDESMPHCYSFQRHISNLRVGDFWFPAIICIGGNAYMAHAEWWRYAIFTRKKHFWMKPVTKNVVCHW